MSKRDDKVLVADILEAAEKISNYLADTTLDIFLTDEMKKDAVVRNFEIIGEAAAQLSSSFKEKYPEVEWRKMIGTRNRIIHDYIGIDYSIVWSITQNNIPTLVKQLQKILSEIN